MSYGHAILFYNYLCIYDEPNHILLLLQVTLNSVPLVAFQKKIVIGQFDMILVTILRSKIFVSILKQISETKYKTCMACEKQKGQIIIGERENKKSNSGDFWIS